jgi:hypothetical protein
MGAASGTGPNMEINHPGGRCWGWGVDGKPDLSLPQVTPDLQPGDRIIVWGTEAGTRVALAESTIQGPQVTGVNYSDGAVTFTIDGTLPAGYNPANLEQRIVNPDLIPYVGRRDVRAVPGGVAAGPRGGYVSDLAVSSTSFTASYDFSSVVDDPATSAVETPADAARIAATTTVQRALSWQLLDSAANRQGATIAENGELGGPGFGGCPQGPANAAPNAGQFSALRASGAATAQITWSPAAAQPGAAAVTGYSVSAVATTPGATGQWAFLGVQTGVGATSATLSGLDTTATYRYEVRAITGTPTTGLGTSLSAPFPAASGAAPGQVATTGDGTPPTVTATQGPDGKVTLAADETADMYYTTDGTNPLASGGLLNESPQVKLYTGPIAISTKDTTVKWVAFDLAGNASQPGSRTFQPAQAASVTKPGQVVNVVATPTTTAGQIGLTWTAPADTGGTPITEYRVAVTGNGAPTSPISVKPATAGAAVPTSLLVGNLNNGTLYAFTVTAVNAQGVSTTASAPPVTARPGDVVTLGLARNKAGDQRLAGSSSSSNSVFTLTARTPNGVTTTIAANLVTVTPAVAPATGVTIDARTRNAAVWPTGTVFTLTSSGGGVATATA